jgi:butyryl-CoA:acetate CoA-transferase
MMTIQYTQEYRQKLRTPDQAVQAIKSGDWLDYGFCQTTCVALDKALAARKAELTDIKVRGGLALRPLAILEADPERKVFTYASWHFSGYERKLHDAGLCSYIPMLYRNKPMFYRNYLETDVAMLQVAPMDRHGYFNFSVSNSASRAIVETAKTVIVEVNEKLPIALGGREECIHISEVDVVVEGENPDLVELPVAPASEVDIKIAKIVVGQIQDGSTIQLGIGGMPNTVGSFIAESDLKDLGIHTEMLVDAYLAMYQAGKITNLRKNIDTGKGVWTFCAGSRQLYQWLDANPGLAAYPVNYTNDPCIIGRLDKVIAINNCVCVDLFGQISSESAGFRHISGTGGQLDFLTGASASHDGKGFICFSSTFADRKTGAVVSRVVPRLSPAEAVTAPRTQAHYLVSEWGMVNLAGRSTWERAELIISIAHPDFRDDLIEEAEKMNIWRYSNKRL